MVRYNTLNQYEKLNPILFYWNFNLADTSYFSCVYLVWVSHYCSQNFVIFHQWVAALVHTQDDDGAPPTAEMSQKCSATL